jgi:hypothetical protein
MLRTLAYLGVEAAGFAPRFVEAARARGTVCVALSLDAPLRNQPVTVSPGEVVWEGVDLLEAGAILVECPLFPWPQPQLPDELRFEPPEPGARISPEREARSLALSAIWIASRTVPVWNPPAAAHLAASPAVALERLAGAGLPVHPWALEPAPDTAGEGRLVLDAAGRDRWHRPSRPAPGEPAIVLEPIRGEVLDLLVVGGGPAGVRGRGWQDVPEEAAALATAAALALGLQIASVSVAAAPASAEILAVEAGPDLAEWNTCLDGRLAPLLLERLEAIALGASS